MVAFHTGLAGRVGQAGVDIFFVISGFIMWVVTERENKPSSFFLRRVARVWPLYIVATVIMAIHNKPALLDVLKSVLFIPYRDSTDHIWPVLVQGWTLNYEIFFYFLVALALLWRRDMMPILLSIILVPLAIVGLVAKPHSAVLATFTSPILLEFLSGIWIGCLLSKKWFVGPRAGSALIVLALAIFAGSNFIITSDQYRFLVWGAPGMLMVIGALSFDMAGLIKISSPLVALGDSSYSIYLFHPFIQKTIIRVMSFAPPLIALLIVLIINGIVGVLIYIGLERPLNRTSRRLLMARA